MDQVSRMVTREEEEEEEWEEEGSLLLRFDTKNSRSLGQKTGAEGSCTDLVVVWTRRKIQSKNETRGVPRVFDKGTLAHMLSRHVTINTHNKCYKAFSDGLCRDYGDDRMCSFSIECVLSPWNVFSLHRMCSLYSLCRDYGADRMCSFSIECVLSP